MSARATHGFAHEDRNAANVDWYTPPSMFEALAIDFDLDPCAPEGGVPWIPAKAHYTKEVDGLVQPWRGRVWCNPPYGKMTGPFLKKMHEHRHGIALVFARTDTQWFHDYAANADAIVFLKGRIKFVDAFARSAGQGAGAGSMLIAWGENCVEAVARTNGKLVRLSAAPSTYRKAA